MSTANPQSYRLPRVLAADGLFLRVARQVAQDCLDVAFEDCIKGNPRRPACREYSQRTAVGAREMANAIITAPDSIVPADAVYPP